MPVVDAHCHHDTTPKRTQAAAGKKKWRFMQKYWHKGAFFQDDADDAFASTSKKLDVLDRDYSAPTGEDKLDRSLLPEVMQVKNFGRRGRTKWTHLKNEDTTDFDAPWAQDPKLVRGARSPGLCLCMLKTRVCTRVIMPCIHRHVCTAEQVRAEDGGHQGFGQAVII